MRRNIWRHIAIIFLQDDSKRTLMAGISVSGAVK